MNLTDKDIEALDNYKTGALTEGERNEIDKRLANDAVFRREAHQYWALESAISAASEIGTRDFLKEINKKMPPIPPPPNNWLKYLIVALAVALAAIVAWYFMGKKEEPKLSGPIASLFEPYPALGITKGEDNNNSKTDALRAYATNDFKKAIPLLQKAFDTEKDSMLLFYKGIALIGNGQSAQAQPILSSLQGSESVPTESIDWYLALAYIEMGDKEKGLNLLKKVAGTEGGYKDKAGELLLKLGK